MYKSIHMSYVKKLVPAYKSKNQSKNNEYLNWFLYDKNTKNIYLIPGGGNDFNTSKIIGAGTNKIVRASKSNKFVIKNIEDISTFEIYINNKYPDIFATYFINNTNLVKQEKLNLDLELEINDNDLAKLEQKIISILEKEGFIDIEIDFHSENVGFDNNNNLKCFDYLTLGYIDNSVAGPAPLISSCTSKYITLKELLKSFTNPKGLVSNHLIQNLNHNENYKLFNNISNTNIVGINIINITKKEIYLNYTYKKLKPYLNDNIIIFAMDYTKYDEGFDD